jgi:RHS repeat-associated protein
MVCDDALYRRTQVKTLANKGKANPIALSEANYGYDGASRLETVSDGQYSAQYHYLANSPLVRQIEYRDGEVLRMATVKEHDRLNRLQSVETKPVNDQAVGYAYEYNAANQRTRATLTDKTAWQYGYDRLGQLTNGVKVDAKAKSLANATFGYTYDSIGNRKTAVASGVEVRYESDALNRYRQAAAFNAGAQASQALGKAIDSTESISDGEAQKVVAEQTGQFTYDADGNLLTDGKWSYTWDAENRLIAMESVASSKAVTCKRLEFAYDARSRRIVKQVYSGVKSGYTAKAASSTVFVYDGWNLVAEVDGQRGDVVRGYLWGTDLSGTPQGAGGVGGLLMVADHTSGGRHFVAYDGNGNVSALVGAQDGVLVEQYEYDPFGNPPASAKSAASGNPFRFSTKYTDEETGLVYYGYLYYDATSGRWISRDPIEERGGLNLHTFARCNPVSFIDDLGLSFTISYLLSEPGTIDPNNPGFLGKTTPVLEQLDFRVSEEYITCANCYTLHVTKDYELNVTTIYPSSQPPRYSENGWDYIIAHEDRRGDVYRRAYYAYLDKVKNVIDWKQLCCSMV